jgi:hypothetical protein
MSIRYLSSFAALMVIYVGASSLHAQTEANTLTWHNDIGRTGANLAETNLTLTNVSASTFGRIHFFETWGKVDAQPLYVAGLKIGGTTHNVLFVATEHNRVYAFDAATGAQLWKTWLMQSNETTGDGQGCSQISPEIGVTATPVIDLSKGPHGAIYLVNMTKDSSGNYHQWINALDLTTGAQLFGGRTEIAGSYNSGETTVKFEPRQYAERVALLEWQGAIYTAWTSHCDRTPYTGWIIGYDASTLKQSSVLNVTPNGSQGAIWMGGAGLAATPLRILFMDANGTFDSTLASNGFPIHQDFGNAFINITLNSEGVPRIADYYATDTTVQQSNADVDLGSGGVIALPPIHDNKGNNYQLAVGAGKDSNIYLVDRTNMGKYHPEGGYVYQVLSGALPNGEFGAPAYFDHKIYYGGAGDNLKAFAFSNAKLVSTPVSRSTTTFAFPGTTPVISSNGAENGIVWAVGHTTLYAYDAEDLSQELYNSNQSGTRDKFGSVDSFISPLVANGRVYVPTQTGVAVFGLLK